MNRFPWAYRCGIGVGLGLGLAMGVMLADDHSRLSQGIRIFGIVLLTVVGAYFQSQVGKMSES